jgi:streptogramin lyase
MSLPLSYRIKPVRVEDSGMRVRQTRNPVQGAGQPLHLAWLGRELWFTGSANCIGQRDQETGVITVFKRTQGVCPTRITQWVDPGHVRLVYVDPEGGRVGTIGSNGAMTEKMFAGARPHALTPDRLGTLWIGCAGPPYVLQVRGDDIAPFMHDTPIRVQTLGLGPDGYLWVFSDNELKGIYLDNGLGPTFALPVQFRGHDLEFEEAHVDSWYCDESRDVIGNLEARGAIIEYQLPAGTAPRRLRVNGRNAIWFIGRGGRSLFKFSPHRVIEYPSPLADADYFDFVFAGDVLWCTEPKANCLSSFPIKGL